METIVLTNAACPAAKAEVYLFGAHVTKWVDRHGVDRLFLSSRAKLDGSKAIRGGIPVCFPQFGKLGSLSQHGFARTSLWTKSESTESSSTVTLVLEDSDATRVLYPHEFRASLQITLEDDGGLFLKFSVENKGSTGPLTFTMALHSYFNVAESASANVTGLNGVQFMDQLDDGKIGSQTREVNFPGEVDRVYIKTPAQVVLNGGDGLRTVVTKQKMDEAVVWNPFIEKAKNMSDLGDDEWKRFVCVEPAVVQEPVTLNSTESWTGTLLLE